MSQKRHYIEHLTTKKVCKNLKEQEFVGFCKESIFEKKDEKVLQKYTGKKGICYYIFKYIEINV